MDAIKRKTLLYKTKVEYGDYTINHVQGCSHGCLYPCYAMMMAKRFGKVRDYNEWIKPKIVSNAIELLKKELPKYKDRIKFVHLCFSTDPFMCGYNEVIDLSLNLIKILNKENIKCTTLTKGIPPFELAGLSKQNEIGISLISLSEGFKKKIEPYTVPYKDRINALYELHKKGCYTWVSFEPYPTPNIIAQNFDDILKIVEFADKFIFGRLNYNERVTRYSLYQEYYNELSHKVIEFCEKRGKEFHIKEKTSTFSKSENKHAA
jgi:DNA repair photolyase